MNIPIIRLEVEGMKHSVHAMLSEYAAQMGADLRYAVDAYCTPENLGQIIRNAAQEAMKKAVEDSVKNFFSWGGGREAIDEAVREMLAAKVATKESKHADQT